MSTYKDFNALAKKLQDVIGSQETKVQKKIVKIFEKIKLTLEAFQAAADELRLDNASTDEKGILLLDDKGGYKFSKEGLKTLTKQIQELENKEVDFKPLNVVNPQGLETFTFLKDFTVGITFEEDEEDEEL
ncbi:MAG: hypothetical protein WCP46_00075 [Alphaproteobacteria bacterium]